MKRQNVTQNSHAVAADQLAGKEKTCDKRSKVKCLSLSVLCIGVFIVCLSFPSFAEDYGDTYPDYVNQSGASFIECQTNLGRGAIVIPINYQCDSIGFSGKQYNPMNITSGTINGYFVLQNGRTYNVTASAFSTFQYRNDTGYYQWSDLTVSKIYNTNIQLVDKQGDRGNTIYNFTPFEWIIVFVLVFNWVYIFMKLTKITSLVGD